VVGDDAKGEDHAKAGHSGDLSGKKLAASRDLAGFRLVLGRHATDRIGDPRPTKLQAIIGAGIVYAFGKTEFAQNVEKQITGVIAVNGRPVRFAPLRPGARPTINSSA
jgi:hypothetical protein